MSKLFGNNEPHMLPKLSEAKTSFLSLSADIEKYAIIQEQGTARNLHKLQLEGSIYDKRNQI